MGHEQIGAYHLYYTQLENGMMHGHYYIDTGESRVKINEDTSNFLELLLDQFRCYVYNALGTTGKEQFTTH